jgi:hypothetical protein
VATTQKIYTRRGITSNLAFTILYTDFYALTSAQTETNYPSYISASGNNNVMMPYMKSGANNNDFLKFKIVDNTGDYALDKDFLRQHRIYLEAKMENYYGYYFQMFPKNGPDDFPIFQAGTQKTPRILLDGKDFNYDLRNQGNGLTGSFNPEISVDNIKFQFMPPDAFVQGAKNLYLSSLASGIYSSILGGIYFMPVIFFNGFVIDKSGRKSSVTFLFEGAEDIWNGYADSIGKPVQFMGWSYSPVVGNRKPYSGALNDSNFYSQFHTAAIRALVNKILESVGFDKGSPYRVAMYFLGTDEF